MGCLTYNQLILAMAISLISYILSNYILLGSVFGYYAFVSSAIYLLGFVLGLYLASYILTYIGAESC